MKPNVVFFLQMSIVYRKVRRKNGNRQNGLVNNVGYAACILRYSNNKKKHCNYLPIPKLIEHECIPSFSKREKALLLTNVRVCSVHHWITVKFQAEFDNLCVEIKWNAENRIDIPIYLCSLLDRFLPLHEQWNTTFCWHFSFIVFSLGFTTFLKKKSEF